MIDVRAAQTEKAEKQIKDPDYTAKHRYTAKPPNKKRNTNSCLPGSLWDKSEHGYHMQWVLDHMECYQRSELDYKPSHENPLRFAYDSAEFYRALTPRFAECVLYYDEKEPLSTLGEGEDTLLAEWLLDLSRGKCMVEQ